MGLKRITKMFLSKAMPPPDELSPNKSADLHFLQQEENVMRHNLGGVLAKTLVIFSRSPSYPTGSLAQLFIIMGIQS